MNDIYDRKTTMKRAAAAALGIGHPSAAGHNMNSLAPGKKKGIFGEEEEEEFSISRESFNN